jgi:hypothetical protein
LPNEFNYSRDEGRVNALITRNERGKLKFNTLEMEIMFDDLFDICKNQDEIEWLQEQLQSYVEGAANEKIEWLEQEGKMVD